MLVLALLLIWLVAAVPLKEPWRTIVLACALVAIVLFALGVGLPLHVAPPIVR